MPFLAQAAAATAEAPTISLTPQLLGLLTLFGTVMLTLIEIVKRMIAEKWPVHRSERAEDGPAPCEFGEAARSDLRKIAEMAAAADDEGRPKWVFPSRRFDQHDAQTLEILRTLSENQRIMTDVLVELKQRPCPIGKDARP